MREKIARAMRPVGWQETGSVSDWCRELERREGYRLADIALEALSEPSEGMVERAADAIAFVEQNTGPGKKYFYGPFNNNQFHRRVDLVKAVSSAMIQAAKEGK